MKKLRNIIFNGVCAKMIQKYFVFFRPEGPPGLCATTSLRGTRGGIPQLRTTRLVFAQSLGGEKCGLDMCISPSFSHIYETIEDSDNHYHCRTHRHKQHVLSSKILVRQLEQDNQLL